MKTWRTQAGDVIAYKDLKDSHLLNIIRYIERKAEEGITSMGGDPSDVDMMWYEDYYDDDVKEMLDYKGILKEALKRDLITQKEYLIKL